MSKRVRTINGVAVNKEFSQLKADVKKLNSIKDFLQLDEFKGLKNIDEIDNLLNNKVGFKNALLSSEALGVGSEYRAISKVFFDVDIQSIEEHISVDVNGLFTIKEEAFNSIQEKYTIYFTEAEERKLKQIEKAMQVLNSIPNNWKQRLIFGNKAVFNSSNLPKL